jgi:hypothetical protein
VFERSILFVDTLRQRADDLLTHERAGKPPLLDFDYELILDARRFRKDRHAVPEDAFLREAEAKLFDAVGKTLTNGRIARDAALERLFDQTYGSGANNQSS